MDELGSSRSGGDYFDVVGGTHINGAFGSFPSLDTAKGMIQKELMGMVGER